MIATKLRLELCLPVKSFVIGKTIKIKMLRTKSSKILLPTLYLAVLLVGCGENKDSDPVSEDIEKMYEEAVAKMIARQISHTGDEPAFTEEEIAEFDRLENQFRAFKEAEREVAYQQHQRNKYQTCVEKNDTACPELVRFTTERNRKDSRTKTLSIHNNLPQNITYQHYFGLIGEDCESDGPVNQWTDVGSVTVRYVGKGEVDLNSYREMGSRLGKCRIRRELKSPNIVFQPDKNPTELMFSYTVPPNIDDMKQICRDKESWDCQQFVRSGVKTIGDRLRHGGFPGREVVIHNSFPEGIAYKHYFSLTDGCISDGPINQWTDTNSIEVYYKGDDMLPRNNNSGSIYVECDVNIRLKITDTDIIFKPVGYADKRPGVEKLKFRIRRR